MSAACAVITGMGGVCAAGTTAAELFDAIRKGERRISPASALGEEALPYPLFLASEEIFQGGRRFSSADTLALAVWAAGEAMAQAGLGPEGNAGLGVVAGTTAGSSLHFLKGYKASRTGIHAVFPDVEDYFSSNLALALGRTWGAGGPALTLGNACTSGADALGLGLDLVRQGRCERVLCGGADALSLVPHTGFARLMIYDTEPCRPFDATRKGLNLGEGAAFFVLESPESAARRGARVLGRILGYGSAADAHHLTAPHPEGRGLVDAMRRAMSEAGLTAEELAFVNAHGTATPDNDKVEGRVFAKCLPGVPVWASKGSTGHTLGAAGALEALACVLALREGVVPRSWGFGEEDPAIRISPTREEVRAVASRALSTSLGFGGGNSALVLEGA